MAASVEARIAGFIERFSPAIAAQLQSARGKLQALFPRGCELVYDNYNALVFAFAASERMSDIVLSIAAYPRWVTLFFMRGVDLADPKQLLVGTGKQIRSIVLTDPDMLGAPAVRALIKQAMKPVAAAFRAAGPRVTTIKAAVAKLRPRRPSAAKKTR